MNYLKNLLRIAALVLAGSALVLSCAQNEIAENPYARTELDMTIDASLGDETRTVNDDRQTCWAADDAISVIHSEEDAEEFYVSRFYYSGENDAFKGRVKEVASINNWYLVYPYREDNTDPREIKIAIPGVQTQAGNASTDHLAGEGFPLYGKSISIPREAGLTIYMRQALAVMNFSVTNTTDSPIIVKEVTITAPVKVSGNFVGDLTKDVVEWNPESVSSNSVTVQVENGEEIPAGEIISFYAGALPFTAKAGSQIKVKVTAIHPDAPATEIPFWRIIDLTEDTAFKANTFKKINLSYDEEHQEDTTTTPGVKKDQHLSFASASFSWTLGTDCSLNVERALPQKVQGAITTVTYSSTDESVATVSGDKITVKAAGRVQIKAVAAETDEYNAAEATMTLTIRNASTPGEGVYVKVTAEPESWDGTYLFVDETAGKAFAAFADNASSYAVDVTISDGVIASDSYIDRYALTVSDAGVKHANASSLEAYDVRNADGKYIFYSSSAIQILDSNTKSNSYSSSSTSYYHAFKYDGGVQVMSSGHSSGYNKYYFTYDSGFTYKGGSSSSQYEGLRVQLYKLEGDPSAVKKSQTLSFANSTVTLALDEATGTQAVQAVSGAKTSVSYTSSNSSVATVSGTTLTIKGFGTTTITATAISTDEYYSASQSYTFVVKKAGTVGENNLENDAISAFLDDAMAQYTDSNRSSVSVVTTYAKNVSATNRLDYPKPVTVSWTNPSNGNDSKTVVVYNDSAMSDEELSVSVSSASDNSADIYNLIPGRTYYYAVKSGSSTLSTGSFITSGRRRMMKVGSDYGQNYANNCRDFGGQETISGKTIKYAKLYRGSNMDNTSSEAKDVLLKYMKIGLDVDLRSGSSSWGGSSGNSLKDALSLGDISTSDLDTYKGHTTETYNSISDLTNTTKMKATLTRVFKAAVNGTPVYIHCMVGADRTGFTCMLIEAVLGVPVEKCDMDYEMTSFSTVGTRTRTGTNDIYYGQGVSLVNQQTGSTYQEKAVNYVVNSLGISSELVQQFQNAMLE